MAKNPPFFLQLHEPQMLEAYLLDKAWLRPGEKILRLEKPGEGNMNCVARATTNERAFIVKQARQWVEKYPSIAAPAERALVEAKFYQTVQRADFFQQAMPCLLHFDPENYLLLLEDLGESADYLYLYQTGADLGQAEAAQLGEYLTHLHHLEFSGEERAAFPDNLALRHLNHEHIFNFPFRNDTGFDLDTIQPGLQAAAQPLRKDDFLIKQVEELGKIYLSPGKTLLHGDYYPGSWLSNPQGFLRKGLLSERTSGGVRIIDPEFCFMGCAEFDFGVMAAHTEMAQLSAERRRQLLSAYEPPAGFDHALAAAFKGTEMLRRLIGLAQLPLQRSLEEKQALLELGRALVMGS